MFSFINKFNILSNNQYAVRKDRNTELATLSLIQSISNSINKNIPIIGLFIDVAKAYDSIDYLILLDKLQCYGFRELAYAWLHSYLICRN